MKDIIKKVKEALSIPVIANGALGNRSDAIACLEYTGADGVMSSEALLENPKLFSKSGDSFFQRDYIHCQLQTVREFREILMSYPAPRPLFQVVRGHLFKMLYRFIDAPLNADLRMLLATGNLEEMFSVVSEIEKRFSQAGLFNPERVAIAEFDEESEDICRENEEKAVALGLLGPTSWYMRHRDDRAANRVLSRRREFSGSSIPARQSV